MYIKRLTLYGFKSFALETHIDFYEGVTVVLGPNGIGKSNIVEAFLWVLGEQSTSRLRLDNSRGLESVIFHGTDERKASSLAEVSLTLDNKTRWIKNHDVDTVMITRKYYRKGLSEYYINDENVRLRDIVDMFLDTGLSKNAYSVIKQGMVDKIAQQKPEDRRALIEDAAGVTKYLERRREATRKLEESERNLLSVKSGIREAEKHYKVLKEQANRTERYYELIDEKKKINIALSVFQVKKLKDIISEQTIELEYSNKKKQELTEELKDLDNKKSDELLKFEQTRAMSVELDKQVSLINSEVIHVENMFIQISNQLDGILKDKKDYSERKESLLSKITQHKNDIINTDLEMNTIVDLIKNSMLEQDSEHNKIASEQNKITSYNNNITLLTQSNDTVQVNIENLRREQYEVINKIIHEIDEKKRDLTNTSFYQNIDKHEQDIDIGFQNLLHAINQKVNTISEFEELGFLENVNETGFNNMVNFLKDLKFSLETEKKDTILLRDIFKEYNKIKDPFIDLLFDKEGTYTQKENIDVAIDDLEKLMKKNREEIESINEKILISNETIIGANSKLTTLTVAQARHEGTKHRLEEKKSMILNSIVSLEEESKSILEKIESINALHNSVNIKSEENKSKLKELESKKISVEKEAKSKASEIKHSESAITNVELNLAKRIKRLSEINENIARLSERVNQNSDKVKDIYTHFYENYAIRLDDFEKQDVAVSDDSVLKTKLETINTKIKNLGSINEMALDEYQEAKERFEFLAKQKEDLEKSKDEIMGIIDEANKKASEDFLETFNEINKKFGETFKILFGGGKAGLVIQNPENILSSPIDIIAQPPGKKMENIVAYSGGELAMAGLALVFAIFLHRPSPFCILDEVDAALDGANIIRYKSMVKELSDKTQFLIITHDEVSATIADRYYGVTSEEKGVSKVYTVEINGEGNVNGSDESLVNN